MYIPNGENFFIIEKSELYKNTIEIKFDFVNSVDLVNLYLILKSYMLSNDFYVINIATSFINIEDKQIISTKENYNFLKNINYTEFCEWVKFKINRDKEYNVKNKIYSLLLMFESSIINFKKEKFNKEDVLQDLKPKYPWNEEILKYLKETSYMGKILAQREKKIIELNRKIRLLKKEIKKKKYR